jgi:hypothetical protein
MSLRKSPTRTPALLAANHANARKSTGPCTPQGKARVALGALRHGVHAPDFLSALGKSRRALEEYKQLYLTLYAALLPDKADDAAMDLLKRTVLHVWAMKQELVRWAASRTEREAWFGQTGGVCPAPLQLLVKRPGWRVRVSVWVRWGRGRGRCRWLQAAGNWKERRARLHVVVTVAASTGHPLLGCLEEVPEGIAPRVVFKLKPECFRKHRSSENVIEQSRIATSVAPTLQGVGSAPAGLKLGATTFAEPLGPVRNRDETISRHIASTKGDLLSWLRPENVALRGSRPSESEDTESWVESIMTRWEKQHGSVPKKEMLPHEIG